MRNDDFEKWTSQWEKAMEEGLFDDAPKPPVPAEQSGPDFFGNYRPNPDPTDIKDVDAAYWSKVYRLSRHSGDSPDPLEELQPINEEELENLVKTTKSHPSEFTLVQADEPDKKTTAAITDDLGKLANPAQYPSRGKDARNKVTPNWAGGEEIQELEAMKMNLEQLESKINAAEGMGDTKKAKSLMSKLDSLRKQIDELSDDLPPDFRTDYLS
jgi:hypothetical protein